MLNRSGDLDDADAREWMSAARRGEFEGAWAASDRLRSRREVVCDVQAPRHLQLIWNGTSLRGNRVLIRCYHGLGDTIQFIRYAPLVQRMARQVVVWAQPELLPLLRTASGIDRLLALHDGDAGVAFDVDVEIMELPYVFRTTIATIPREMPYLSVPRVRLDGDGVRVGLAWSAGPWDEQRSIPFACVRRLFDIDGITWYSLQRGAGVGEADARLRHVDTGDAIRTGGVMRGLDLVVSIDSLPAHLAGALAAPVWTLLPYEADWRWMDGRADSPWYPTMRLFRQPSPGDWDAVVAEVVEALATLGAPSAATWRSRAASRTSAGRS